MMVASDATVCTRLVVSERDGVQQMRPWAVSNGSALSLHAQVIVDLIDISALSWGVSYHRLAT